MQKHLSWVVFWYIHRKKKHAIFLIFLKGTEVWTLVKISSLEIAGFFPPVYKIKISIYLKL